LGFIAHAGDGHPGVTVGLRTVGSSSLFMVRGMAMRRVTANILNRILVFVFSIFGAR
jgi:hypothetical protein